MRLNGRLFLAIAIACFLGLPARAHQTYDYAWYGVDLVQLHSEVLGGNKSYLYNTTQSVSSWHIPQITCNNSGGVFSDNGYCLLRFNNSNLDAGIWSLTSFGSLVNDDVYLVGSTVIPLNTTPVDALTDDQKALLAVIDPHVYTGFL